MPGRGPFLPTIAAAARATTADFVGRRRCSAGVARALAVGRGEHQLAQQFLETPTLLVLKAKREMIEQFGMRRRVPEVPKSSTVSTMPTPKSCSHTRLTITRAVSGFSSETNQRANAKSIMDRAGGQRRQGVRRAGLDFVALVEPESTRKDEGRTPLVLRQLAHHRYGNAGNLFGNLRQFGQLRVGRQRTPATAQVRARRCSMKRNTFRGRSPTPRRRRCRGPGRV